MVSFQKNEFILTQLNPRVANANEERLPTNSSDQQQSDNQEPIYIMVAGRKKVEVVRLPCEKDFLSLSTFTNHFPCATALQYSVRCSLKLN